jgi:hypothetical protein
LAGEPAAGLATGAESLRATAEERSAGHGGVDVVGAWDVLAAAAQRRFGKAKENEIQGMVEKAVGLLGPSDASRLSAPRELQRLQEEAVAVVAEQLLQQRWKPGDELGGRRGFWPSRSATRCCRG